MANTMNMSMEKVTQVETKRSEAMIKGSLFAGMKVRLPFLILALAGGLLAAGVIDAFEEVLEEIFIVAVFIPVIMDMGGSVGTQSSTAFARGLALGHIDMSVFKKHLGRELVVGVVMGAIVGAVTGVLAYIWQGEAGLGLAVGLSLLITMTVASFLGFLVPYVLFKLKMDQAAGSDPIITTIKDITGLLVYFVLVSTFLSSLM